MLDNIENDFVKIQRNSHRTLKILMKITLRQIRIPIKLHMLDVLIHTTGNVYCQTREDPNRNFPQVRLSYSTSDRKVVLTHQTYAPPDDGESEELIDLEVQILMSVKKGVK
ncbi:hypothetical protein KUTeg_018301 [Tegillarca granosa]|uniref:Uncharacterized protein n=1 Tax=Tegillarca granosa TaxID=220873 RepID=A0ABQ9EHH8_TEGGR|nr:hypothetical protein KUTeg_018301 [Tegillarca granosa]